VLLGELEHRLRRALKLFGRLGAPPLLLLLLLPGENVPFFQSRRREAAAVGVGMKYDICSAQIPKRNTHLLIEQKDLLSTKLLSCTILKESMVV
jgi:hypothetical protein